ncbi:MAG: hypothetical protein AAF750_09785, partial [Planctomycetota bacterium]
REIEYRDLRVEGHRTGDFRLSIGTSHYSTDDHRGHIEDVLVDGYHTETTLTASRFAGYDDDHRVNTITLQNVTAAGLPAQPVDLVAEVQHAAGITFQGHPVDNTPEQTTT